MVTFHMPQLLIPVRWSDVRAYCEDAARRLARRLSGLPPLPSSEEN